MSKDTICVGAIAGSFGVKGEVRLKSFCAEPADIASYGPLASEDGATSWTIKLTRPVKGGFAARMTGVATKEQADEMRGTRLYAPRDALPALPDDEYYYTDLIGIDVVDTGGAPLGNVAAVLNHGAGDLLEVRMPGEKPLLLPFTRENVPTVDLTARRIVADPPEEA